MTMSLQCIEPNAAGIDVGSFSHFVAVPSDKDQDRYSAGINKSDLFQCTEYQHVTMCYLRGIKESKRLVLAICGAEHLAFC